MQVIDKALAEPEGSDRADCRVYIAPVRSRSSMNSPDFKAPLWIGDSSEARVLSINFKLVSAPLNTQAAIVPEFLWRSSSRGEENLLPSATAKKAYLYMTIVVVVGSERNEYGTPLGMKNQSPGANTLPAYVSDPLRTVRRLPPGHARQLAFKPNLQIIRRSRRPLLRGLE